MSVYETLVGPVSRIGDAPDIQHTAGLIFEQMAKHCFA